MIRSIPVIVLVNVSISRAGRSVQAAFALLEAGGWGLGRIPLIRALASVVLAGRNVFFCDTCNGFGSCINGDGGLAGLLLSGEGVGLVFGFFGAGLGAVGCHFEFEAFDVWS